MTNFILMKLLELSSNSSVIIRLLLVNSCLGLAIYVYTMTDFLYP